MLNRLAARGRCGQACACATAEQCACKLQRRDPRGRSGRVTACRDRRRSLRQDGDPVNADKCSAAQNLPSGRLVRAGRSHVKARASDGVETGTVVATDDPLPLGGPVVQVRRATRAHALVHRPAALRQPCQLCVQAHPHSLHRFGAPHRDAVEAHACQSDQRPREGAARCSPHSHSLRRPSQSAVRLLTLFGKGCAGLRRTRDGRRAIAAAVPSGACACAEGETVGEWAWHGMACVCLHWRSGSYRCRSELQSATWSLQTEAHRTARSGRADGYSRKAG